MVAYIPGSNSDDAHVCKSTRRCEFMYRSCWVPLPPYMGRPVGSLLIVVGLPPNTAQFSKTNGIKSQSNK